MFFTNLRRIIRSGFVGFWRNAFVSLSSMLVMAVTIFVVGALYFTGIILEETLENIRERVDINVYITQEATEEETLSLQSKLENLEQVESVEYTSRDQALAEFQEENPDFNEAFDVLEKNPLNASLNVLATDTSEYDQIQSFLESNAALTEDGENIVERSNYNNNQVVIERLTSIMETTERVGIYATILLFVLSIIITFNTIRLAIFTSREEISVMRLVGASNTYIRGPFVITGIIGGIFAGTIVLMIFYPLTLWLGPQAQNFFGSVNIFDHYIDNFLELALIFVGLGIILGALSSFLAVRRYLYY